MRVGVVAGGPQPGASVGSGAVAHVAVAAELDAPADAVAADGVVPPEPPDAQAAIRQATAHAPTRRENRGMATG